MRIKEPLVVRDYHQGWSHYVTWLVCPVSWTHKEARRAYRDRYGEEPDNAISVPGHDSVPGHIKVGPVVTDIVPSARCSFDGKPESACS